MSYEGNREGEQLYVSDSNVYITNDSLFPQDTSSLSRSIKLYRKLRLGD